MSTDEATLSFRDLRDQLRLRHIALRLEGDRLVAADPEGRLTPAIDASLRVHRDQLVEWLTSSPSQVLVIEQAIADAGQGTDLEHALDRAQEAYEHDQITVQECVEELGRRQSRRAVEPIVKLYAEPPGHTHNPLFQLKCLDALHAILGKEARPFFTAELPKATTETVANHLKRLLEES